MSKKIILFLLLTITLLCSCSYNSKILKDGYEKLIPMVNHKIAVNFNPQMKLIMVNDFITIDRAQFKDRISASFILNKNIALEDVRLNDQILFVREIIQYNESFFEPGITKENIERVKNYGRIYQVEFPKYTDGVDEIVLNIKYTLRVKDEFKCATLKASELKLLGKYFWLPEAFNNNLSADVKITTLKNIKIKLDFPNIKEEISGFLKKTSFKIDSFRNSFDIISE